MTEYDSAALQDAVTADCTDLQPRDARALTEPMSVLPDQGRANGADGLYLVVSASGAEYLVDVREDTCECPDARHRDPEGGCKHVRRVKYAAGRLAIPPSVAADAVDPHLGRHVEGTPTKAVADGGETAPTSVGSTERADAGGRGDDRPDDCQCAAWPDRLALPCWPCYREGYDEAATDQ